jgi:Amt family ammonium transporter
MVFHCHVSLQTYRSFPILTNDDSYIILLVINKIPTLYLRLADEDEIIGTDWAEMGERAYAYLPFDEEIATPTSRRSGDSSEDNVVVGVRSEKKSSQHLNKVKKLLMVDRTTVIKGVPDLIEEPVLDYGQQKDLGAYHLNKLNEPTGGDLLQKTSAKMREEHQAHQPIHFEGHPMQTVHHENSDDTIEVINSYKDSSSNSSTNSEKMKEKA